MQKLASAVHEVEQATAAVGSTEMKLTATFSSPFSLTFFPPYIFLDRIFRLVWFLQQWHIILYFYLLLSYTFLGVFAIFVWSSTFG
jgi:hypothetical protein